ncbi:MAG: hypothetical protein J7494_10425 [Sphingobium sp.]|nr:hypothetical protein [Sphingobium sp.]
MRSFIITLDGEELGDSKRIEFDAPDPASAFSILEREPLGKTAILWEGEKRLGTLRRTRIGGGWQLSA